MAKASAAKAPAAAPQGVAAPPAETPIEKLVVRSLAAGFRRAGRAWPAEEVTVGADEFTAGQIEQILAEPMLVVIAVRAAR